MKKIDDDVTENSFSTSILSYPFGVQAASP